MSRTTLVARVTLLCLSSIPICVPAAAQVSSSAATVFVRKDCTDYPDCFVDSDTDPNDGIAALQSWIWSGATPRNPTSTAPLSVEFGPGTFVGAISCPLQTPVAAGHVTFRGTGRERTVVSGAVFAHSCESLGFQDLTVQADGTVLEIAVTWNGSGDSDWSDVELLGGLAAWLDGSCPGDPASDGFSGLHYFWDSRLQGRLMGVASQCSQTWLYGSEVEVRPQPGDVNIFPLGQIGVLVANRGDVRLFGSSVRVSGAAMTSAGGDFFGVRVGQPLNLIPPFLPDGFGEFHMHGGLISVDSSTVAGVDALGVSAERLAQTAYAPEPRAHTPGTVFEVSAHPAAVAHRLASGPNPALVQSPYLWRPGDVAPGVASLPGQDLFVETDCYPDTIDPGTGSTIPGGCGGAGSPEPHLMIYWPDHPNCSASPWWDTALNACWKP